MPQSLIFEFGLMHQVLVDRKHMSYVVATLALGSRPKQGHAKVLAKNEA